MFSKTQNSTSQNAQNWEWSESVILICIKARSSQTSLLIESQLCHTFPQKPVTCLLSDAGLDRFTFHNHMTVYTTYCCCTPGDSVSWCSVQELLHVDHFKHSVYSCITGRSGVSVGWTERGGRVHSICEDGNEFRRESSESRESLAQSRWPEFGVWCTFISDESNVSQ